MPFTFVVVVIREGPLVHIPNAFVLEKDLPILEFFVKDLTKHLIQSMPFFTLVKAKTWILLICWSWCWISKRQSDN